MQMIPSAHFCISEPFPVCRGATRPPRRAAVFFFSLSPFFFGLPLPPPTARSPLSVAAVLVMAVCPWCKLAVGSQVARVTVIDVQVFSSSHTETPEQHTHSTHTHTHAEAQYACMHPIVVHMQVVVYLHNYAH